MLAAADVYSPKHLFLLTLFFATCSCRGGFSRLRNSMKIGDMRCASTAPQHVSFDICRITRAATFTRVEGLCHNKVLPLNSMLVNVRTFQKRGNAFAPFVLNLDLDWCAFIEKRNNLVMARLFDMFERYSNLNEKCPITTEYVYVNITMPTAVGFPLPFKAPSGNYRVDVNVTYNRIGSLLVNAYFNM